MQKCFKIKEKTIKQSINNFDKYASIYDELIYDDRNSIEEKISSLKIKDIEDGTKTKSNWFPEIDADVFISHSHEDVKLAKSLAVYINEETGLKSFIDSEIWGNYADLLRNIDNNYCKFPDKNLYNYELRNYSTSHVHMMLNIALIEMIHKCNYFIFIETPNSLKDDELIYNGQIKKTNSPWIYSELMITKIIKTTIDRYKSAEHIKTFSKKNECEILYKVDTSHLEEISNLIEIKKYIS
ncbi:hypothetical protein [Brachyspira innocens]|uniref:hypothetical protein n=1 Tax=Brachyspira innocens TaxID=13264 RepID=UPI0026F362FB|nr:hypothetical protein [Brachyspira innocens]